MVENNCACKDNLWAHCGALGDALRRASEAERKVEELEAQLSLIPPKTATWRAGEEPAGFFSARYFDEDGD